jgi:hypothetical protein
LEKRRGGQSEALRSKLRALSGTPFFPKRQSEAFASLKLQTNKKITLGKTMVSMVLHRVYIGSYWFYLGLPRFTYWFYLGFIWFYLGSM